MRKSHPAIFSLMPFVLSLSIDLLCLLLLFLPRACYFFSDQPQHSRTLRCLDNIGSHSKHDGSSYFPTARRSSTSTAIPNATVFFPFLVQIYLNNFTLGWTDQPAFTLVTFSSAAIIIFYIPTAGGLINISQFLHVAVVFFCNC